MIRGMSTGKGMRVIGLLWASVGFGQPTNIDWTPTGKLAEARQSACAVRLGNGRILVAGGTGAAGDLASAELYTSDGTFVPAAPMSAVRTRHSCTLLNDGRVLVAGGDDLGAAEVYDPAADAWQGVTGTIDGWAGHAAVRLADGRVLLAGGAAGERPVASLAVFDPAANSLETLDAVLSEPRQEHAAVSLANGKVLIIGGRNESGAVASVDVFDPVAGTVAAGPALAAARAAFSATLLDDGRVLAAGGSNGTKELDSAELYDPEVGAWSTVGAKMNGARRNHLALLIPGNGGVLLAGGTASGETLATTELFVPADGSFVALGQLTAPRSNLAGAIAGPGTVLAAGGVNADGPQNACGILLLPAIQFSKPNFHPLDTVQLSGANFRPGSTVTFALDFPPITTNNLAQIGIPLPSAGRKGPGRQQVVLPPVNRLITKSVTLPPGGTFQLFAGFGPVPIVATVVGDAGLMVRITASAPGGLSATASVPVRVATLLTVTTPQPQFEGLNATIVGQLNRNFNPGPVTGTVTIGVNTPGVPGKVSAFPVNSTNNPVFFSAPQTALAAGAYAVSGNYTGDTKHEPASAAGSFTVVSRTPTIQLTAPATATVGSTVNVQATVASAGPVSAAPAPTGAVTFSQSGFSIGAGTVLIQRAGSSAQLTTQLPVTPLTLQPISLTAAFAGDSTYRAVTSSPVTISVQKATPALTLVMQAGTFSCGSPTTIAATLTFPPAIGLTSRTVTLTALASDGSVRGLQGGMIPLTPSAQTPGLATGSVSLTLPAFVRAIGGDFSQDPLLNSVSAPATSAAVQPVPVTLKLGVAPSFGDPNTVLDMPATLTNPATLAASVTAVSNCAAPQPSGSLEFLDGGVSLGIVPLPVPPLLDGTSNTILFGETLSVAGRVTVSRPVGPRSLQVRYSGDATHQGGTSAPVMVTFQ